VKVRATLEAGKDETELTWGLDDGDHDDAALLRSNEDLEVNSIVDGTRIPLMCAADPIGLECRPPA
jgi:hypothetical protein